MAAWLTLLGLSVAMLVAGGIICRAAVAGPSSPPGRPAVQLVDDAPSDAPSPSPSSSPSATASCDSSSGLYPASGVSPLDQSSPLVCVTVTDSTGASAAQQQSTHDALVWGLGVCGFFLAGIFGLLATRR